MKKQIILISIIFWFLSGIIHAQDIIYKLDGTKEEVKVLEIDKKEIHYKKFSNTEGPTYSIDRSNVVMITYENGNFDLLNKPVIEGKKNVEFARNILSYHLFDLVFNEFTISYERLLKEGKIGIQIPLSFGYNRSNFYSDNFRSLFYSGATLNFYPTGQGIFKYFMGPQLILGYGEEQDYVDYFDDQGNYIGTENLTTQSFYGKFFVNNGIIFTPIKNLSISTYLSLGIRYLNKSPQDNDVVKTDAHYSINLSYRF